MISVSQPRNPGRSYKLHHVIPKSSTIPAEGSGFDNFTYFFRYEDSRDTFQIPHDLKILREVFRCPEGNYAARNAYWTSHCLIDLINQGPKEKRRGRLVQVADLRQTYAGLSELYQKHKTTHDIPLP